MATMKVEDSLSGADVDVELPLTPGRAAAAASRPVAVSTEDLAAINAITAKLTADPATQTTLAAVLAKIIAAPATEAKQDTLIAKDFATQTTLAAVLAKIIAAPATEAKQDALTTLIGQVSASPTENTVLERLQAIETAIVAATVSDTTALEPQAYEWVDASASTQTLGATGASGDYLAHVLIIPGTTSPGAVSIKDGSDTARTIFTGGTDSVGSLVPFSVPINAVSSSGAWQITTGTNVTAFGVGTFT